MAEDLQASLERIGDDLDLGEYEIATYLAVLEHGDLTTTEIAEHTDVPQPRVYDTVRSLDDRGLVELQETRPMRVIAVDPEEAFGALRTSLADVVTDLESRYTTPARGTEAVALVKSRSTILRYLEEAIDDADYELIISLTPTLLERFSDGLARAIERDVSVELIVAPANGAPDPDRFDYSRVSTVARGRRGVTTPVLAVADGEHSIYATQDAVKDDTDRYGVVFNRSNLGFLVSGFFGTVLWTTADETLFADGKDWQFPRRYASIRRCIKDLRDMDLDAYVTVEGRDVITGDPRVVQGKVSRTHFTEDQEVATLIVETDEDEVSVGGRMAAYEDIEAHEIRLDLSEPP